MIIIDHQLFDSYLVSIYIKISNMKITHLFLLHRNISIQYTLQTFNVSLNVWNHSHEILKIMITHDIFSMKVIPCT